MDKTKGMRAVRRRLQCWRRNHGGRGRRVPEELWELAAEVARVEGVEATARALRLDAVRLARRLEGGARQVATGAQRAPLEYVELEASEVGVRQRASVVEVVSRGGERLRIEVAGTVDVPGVVRAFADLRP